MASAGVRAIRELKEEDPELMSRSVPQLGGAVLCAEALRLVEDGEGGAAGAVGAAGGSTVRRERRGCLLR